MTYFDRKPRLPINMFHQFEDCMFFHFSSAEIRVPAVASYSYNSSSLVAHKIMVHLTINGILGYVKQAHTELCCSHILPIFFQ